MPETLANITGSTAPAPAPDRGDLGPPIVRESAITPGSPEWDQMSVEQRHAQLRGPENPRARGHSPSRDHHEAVEARRGEAAPAAPAGEDQPAGEKFKVGKYEISEAEVGKMMERQAQEDLRKATIPPTPDKYEAKLPADFKAPGGLEYKFDAADPSLVAARNWAHSKGLSQDDFSQLLSLHAAHVAGQEAVLVDRARAEIAKAGVNAPQRVDAVSQWITAEVGEADAKPIRATIVTDAHLRFYEKMMTKITSQGTVPFSQQHRVPPDANNIPNYEGMTYAQRREAQDQLAARRLR